MLSYLLIVQTMLKTELVFLLCFYQTNTSIEPRKFACKTGELLLLAILSFPLEEGTNASCRFVRYTWTARMFTCRISFAQESQRLLWDV